MKIAKALILPVVAVAAISIFCKAQGGSSQEQSASAAPSPIASPLPYTVPAGDYSTTSTYVSPCAELVNAGLASLGKEDAEPRKVHFEFTLTLPANK